MLGLRQTLRLAFGGLLAILLIVGLTSILLLNKYSATLETIFRENYDTVLYAQNMKDAVDVLDSVAENSLWSRDPGAAATRDGALQSFEENLARELGNITLPGEREAADRLQQQWQSYRQNVLLHTGRSDGDDGNRRAFYRDTLRRQADAAKATAQHIIDINLANMVSVDGEVRAEAVAAKRAMIALMVFGALLAASLAGLLARAVLRPVQALMASVREVERGNLDLAVPVSSTDELGQLAEAFNKMAARLREFRSSDRARLVRTQRTTELAVNSFPDAVAVVGLDGKVELANEAAQRLFELKPGAAVTDLPDPALEKILRETIASRRPFEPRGYEAAIERFDGGPRIFQPKAVPIVGDDGALIGVTLVLADVTNLRRLDEMKSGLVSTVSHELKTPLTSIRMATHLLLEGRLGDLTPRQTELLAAACEDSDKLDSIIDNLLDIGRLESGREQMELELFSVAQLLEGAARAHGALFRDKGVHLDVEVPAGLPMVLADANRLRHVFANLLDNALRHTPAEGRVTLSARAADGFVEVSVSDSGSGIAARHLPRIFDRFYRAGDAATQPGAGLGLAIVKEVVEAHGGRVSVESSEGNGSTFRFTLKTAPVAIAARTTPA